jgi:hypothetical protein
MAFNEADHFRWVFGSEIGLPRFEQWLLEASSAASFLPLNCEVFVGSVR